MMILQTYVAASKFKRICLPEVHLSSLVLPPQGSCTACIVMLDGSTLRASNLGDSGFLVLRNSQIVFQSPTQQHQFNFPYQLGGPESRGDPPDAADVSLLQDATI